MPVEKLSSDVLRVHKGISFVGISTCFLCHDGNGEVFLAKRSKKARDEHGRWEMGGGGLKWGCKVEENLRRELKEEYGLEPLELEFLGYRDVFREHSDGTTSHWLALDFAVQVDRRQVKIMEPDMFDDSGWFRLNALPSPLHSQQHVTLEKFAKRIDQIINRAA